MESPIDLYDDIIKNQEIEPFEIVDIEKQIYGEVVNNGECINISVSSQNSPIIKGGGLPYPEYVVSQFMFRWDSEHTINREQFAMEVQIVTIAKQCMNFDNALAKGGVAIFSTLYTLSLNDNEGLNELLPLIPFISDEIGRSVPYDVLKLSHFFPKNFNEFYRYKGSLTFPPFTSGVVWTIFKEKQPVTRPQMGLLCDIQDENGRLIVRNNSASRNEKTVFYSSGKKNKCQYPTSQQKPKKQEVEEEGINKTFFESIFHEGPKVAKGKKKLGNGSRNSGQISENEETCYKWGYKKLNDNKSGSNKLDDNQSKYDEWGYNFSEVEKEGTANVVLQSKREIQNTKTQTDVKRKPMPTTRSTDALNHGVCCSDKNSSPSKPYPFMLDW